MFCSDVIAAALQQRLKDLPNVEVLYGTSVRAIDTGSDFDWASVTTSAGRKLTARLLASL